MSTNGVVRNEGFAKTGKVKKAVAVSKQGVKVNDKGNKKGVSGNQRKGKATK